MDERSRARRKSSRRGTTPPLSPSERQEYTLYVYEYSYTVESWKLTEGPMEQNSERAEDRSQTASLAASESEQKRPSPIRHSYMKPQRDQRAYSRTINWSSIGRGAQCVTETQSESPGSVNLIRYPFSTSIDHRTLEMRYC